VHPQRGQARPVCRDGLRDVRLVRTGGGEAESADPRRENKNISRRDAPADCERNPLIEEQMARASGNTVRTTQDDNAGSHPARIGYA